MLQIYSNLHVWKEVSRWSCAALMHLSNILSISQRFLRRHSQNNVARRNSEVYSHVKPSVLTATCQRQDLVNRTGPILWRSTVAHNIHTIYTRYTYDVTDDAAWSTLILWHCRSGERWHVWEASRSSESTWSLRPADGAEEFKGSWEDQDTNTWAV